MIKLENEHYIRFILLLIKGGTEVLRKTVIKGLEKQNIGLNGFLLANKVDICKSKEISKLQRDILYPPSPHFSDISKWDISLLSYIAIDFLKDELSGTEKIAVKKIRDMRNEVHAHSNDASIDTRTFTNVWSELSLIITTLSYSLPYEERQALTDLISTLSSDQLDIYKAIEELKLPEHRDECFEFIQTSLDNLKRSHTELDLKVDGNHQDVIQISQTMCQGLSDIKKQLFDMKISMENRGESTKIVNTMFGRVRVSADEQIIIDTAENVLLSASVESVRKCKPSDTLTAVKEKVDTFVEDFEGLNVKVDRVDEGSIVFTFTCSSLGAVIDLIDYFQSSLIERRLYDIAVALESVICHKVRLCASILVEPLQDILKKLQGNVSMDIDSGKNLTEKFKEVHVGEDGFKSTKSDTEDFASKSLEGNIATRTKEMHADQTQGAAKRPKNERKKAILERESKRQKIEEENEAKIAEGEMTSNVIKGQAMVFGQGKPEVMDYAPKQLTIPDTSSGNLFSIESEKRNDGTGKQTLYDKNSEREADVKKEKKTEINLEALDLSAADTEHTHAQYGDFGHDVDAVFKVQTKSQTKKALAELKTDYGNKKQKEAATLSGPATNTFTTERTMIKLENEHYIRFILLLIKGGTEVLRKTVIKGLEKQKISLNEFLQANKVDICKSKQISKLQRDILYPPSPHFSDISKWDISLLLYIAIDFLSDVLSGTEKIALKKIRDMRKEVHAHSNDASIDTRTFSYIWSTLSLIIATLSYSLPDEDRQGLMDLISILSSGQLDIHKAIEELILLERRDEFFECIQTSLDNLQRSHTELALAVDKCHQGTTHDWSNAIDTSDEDMAKHLLEEGILPTNDQLQKAFSEFGNTSPTMKYICERIEEWLIDSSENVVDVKACYKYTRPMKVVFVVFSATGKHYEIDDKCQYPIEVRRQSSHEANRIIDLEVHEHLHFDKADMDIISQCLRDESPGLMEKHSNLNMTSASHYKSSEYGYGNKNTKITCIVFYVSAKGFIPVGEKILPTQIGSFKTDVREGRFVLSGGGRPGSKHKNIKIGCQISCNDSYGTVGGFVQHPRFGLCAMTCAHTLLTVEEFEQLYNRGNIQLISRGQYKPKGAESTWLSRECHQPGEPDKMGTLVDAIACPGDKETAGLDIAFVEVDKSRHPVTGEFPDFKRPKQSSSCLHSKGTFNERKLKFKDGSVFERAEIPSTNTAVKYGATTTFTAGTLQVHGSSVRPELNEYIHLQRKKKKHSAKTNKILKYTLHDQINIFSSGSDFSEKGDSGSLVLSMCEGNTLVAFGILTGGGKDNKISFATPLSNILERIGLSRPFSLVDFGNEKRLHKIESNVEEFSKQTNKNFDALNKKIDDSNKQNKAILEKILEHVGNDNTKKNQNDKNPDQESTE